MYKEGTDRRSDGFFNSSLTQLHSMSDQVLAVKNTASIMEIRPDIKADLITTDRDHEGYYTKRSYEDGLLVEVKPMDGGASHEIGFVISSGSVMGIRKQFTSIRAIDQGLVEIRLDALGLKNTPESKARTGVFLNQIANFCRVGSMASLPSGNTRGRLDVVSMPEVYRIHLLGTIARQGYSWIELDDSIPLQTFKKLSETARSNGTKVMLSSYPEDKIEWEPPSDELLGMCDGIMVFMKVNTGPSFRRLVRTAGRIRSAAADKLKVIRTRPGSMKISRNVLGLLGLDLSFVPMEDDHTPSTRIENYDKNISDFFQRCGIDIKLRNMEWSLSSKTITESTQILIHIGNPIENDISLRLNNILSKRMGLDRVMLPYRCTHDTIDSEMERLKSMNAAGMYVDLPFRSTMLSRLDWCDPISKLSGGVNTVSFDQGRLNGYNTEIYSISDTLNSLDGVNKGSKILVLGTGLPGRSASLGSAIFGMRTYLAGPTLDRVRSITSSLGNGIEGISFNDILRSKDGFDMIINTIPFTEGPFKGGQPAPEEIVRKVEPKIGLDLNRAYKWTPFLSSIESRGGYPVQGSEVLVHSTKRESKLMTGLEVDEEMMRDIILSLM